VGDLSDWQTGRLIYLVILAAALLFWFVSSNRQSLGQTARHAIAWVMIFIGAIAAVGLWDDIRSTVRPMQSVMTDATGVRLPRQPDGHFHATLRVNDAPVNFLVDTGATGIVLSRPDAIAAGIDMQDLVFTGRAKTANGIVRTAPVRIDTMSLGPVTDRNLRAWVTDGDMRTSLLGMDYLGLWSRIAIEGDSLDLIR
jgi:aspartyl protease family protein